MDREGCLAAGPLSWNLRVGTMSDVVEMEDDWEFLFDLCGYVRPCLPWPALPPRLRHPHPGLGHAGRVD